MKDCTDPRGHEWESTSFRIAAGSIPVKCVRPDCGATGFQLDPESEVVPQSLGQPGEELF
jgi:hypothetical protein